MRPATRRWTLLSVLTGLACTVPNPAYHGLSPGNDDAAAAEPEIDASAPPAPRDLRAPDRATGDPAAPVAPDAAAPAPDAPAPPIDASAPDVRRDAGPDARPVLPSDLVAYWRLDPSSGGTVVADDTGNNPGMLETGAMWTAGGFSTARFDNGGAVVLDGVDGYVELGTKTLPALGHAKTISFWFWFAVVPTVRKDLVVLSNPAQRASVQVGLDNGALALWTWAEPGTDISSPRKASAAGWHHAAYTYDGKTQAIYLDGTTAGSTTQPPFDLPVTSALLGAYDPTEGSSEKFAGRIDDVRIYDRALTAAEISALAAGAP